MSIGSSVSAISAARPRRATPARARTTAATRSWTTGPCAPISASVEYDDELRPLDLIPDVIPFVGLLDDVLLVSLVVDGLLNHVDRAVLLKYWPGRPASLDAVAAVARRLARWVPGRVKDRIFGDRRRTTAG